MGVIGDAGGSHHEGDGGWHTGGQEEASGRCSRGRAVHVLGRERTAGGSRAGGGARMLVIAAAVATVMGGAAEARFGGSFSGKGGRALLRLRGGSQRAKELEELGVLSRVSSSKRLQDLDPFEWEDKSEALDMLKNGVRFSHNGPDRYDGDVERTVWWKERGLDRSGGKKVAIAHAVREALSMSKDARVRRNGRHRRSLVQRAVFNDDPQQPNSLVDMSHIFACADAAICAENSTAPALGDPFLWGVLSRIPNMIPFLATPARPRAQALNDTPAANVSAANASAVMDEAPGADAPKPSSAFWRLMTRCFTGACGEASGTSTEGCGAVAHSTGAQVQPAQPQLPALTGEEINDQLVDVLMQTIEGAAWEEICDADGIRVCRTKLSADTLIGGRPVGETASKFLCVKAEAVLDASPAQVYTLFVDNTRVREYNEFCKQIKDLQYVNSTTKVTWSASSRIGPFKERDFVTRVHYRTLTDDTLLVVNRAEDHPLAPQSDRYLRMEIVLGGNVMRAVPGMKDKTAFTMLTHVNPGGVAETRLGTMIMNSAAANGPTKFVQGLRECLARDAAGVPAPAIVENEEEIEFGRVLLDNYHITDMHKVLQTCPAGIT